MKWFVGALLILIAALILESGLLAYSMYVLLGVMVVSHFLARAWTGHLTATRVCNRDTAEVGETVAVQVNVKNQGWMVVPWLLIEEEQSVLGYAYATPWRARQAYRYSVESTIYLRAEATGRGLGLALYAELLRELRLKIRDSHKLATTVGFGPRFLHSTGQLHKGGPDTCVVLQIVADDPDDPMIPGMNVGFRTLLAAQALGDWMSLDKRGRRGVRVHLKGAIEPALRALVSAVEEALTVKA